MRRGFSLIEVLIFVSILSIFFVIAISIATATLRNTKVNEHKILATRYAEELSDWLRSQREIDFQTFSSTFASTSGTMYCFKTTPIVFATPTPPPTTQFSSGWPSAGACGGTDLIDSLYTREVTLTRSGGPPATSVTANIRVSWQELNATYTVPVDVTFSILE